jgi:PAS domain S-box-containing protein
VTDLQPASTSGSSPADGDGSTTAAAATRVRGWFGWVIVELAADAIMVVNEARRVLLANRAAELLFGYDRDTLLRLEIDTLVPDLRPNLDTGSVDGDARHADGSTFPITVDLHTIKDSQGSLVVAIARQTSAPSSDDAARSRGALPAPLDPSMLHQVVGHLFVARRHLHGVLDGADAAVAGRLGPVARELDLALGGLDRALGALRHR